MDETQRRRMIWTAIALAGAYFFVTLVLAVTDSVSDGWYAVGAVLYLGIVVIAVIGFILERAPDDASETAHLYVPVEVREVQDRRTAETRFDETPLGVTETVIFRTPTGHVVQRTRGIGADATHAFEVDHRGSIHDELAIHEAIEAVGLAEADDPDPAELHEALARWGTRGEPDRPDDADATGTGDASHQTTTPTVTNARSTE